jgi:hypothetical protein
MSMGEFAVMETTPQRDGGRRRPEKLKLVQRAPSHPGRDPRTPAPSERSAEQEGPETLRRILGEVDPG